MVKRLIYTYKADNNAAPTLGAQKQQGQEKIERSTQQRDSTQQNRAEKGHCTAQPKGGNPLWGAMEKWLGLPLNTGAMFTAQSK